MLRSRYGALAFVVVAVVVNGCAQPPPQLVAPATSPASATASSAPAPSAPAAANVAPPKAPSVLAKRELVDELRCEAEMFRVGARSLLACGEDILVLEGAQLRLDATLSAGLGLVVNDLGGRRIAYMAGEFPDAAWAETLEVSGGGNAHTLRFFRWRKDRWVATGKSAELGGAEERVAFAWTADGMGVLAAKAFESTRFFAFSGKPAIAPSLTSAKQSKAAQEQYPCRSVMIAPQHAVQLAPGDVMVLSGQMCAIPGSPNEDTRMGVERLRVGQKQGEVTALPMPSDLPAGVIWNVDGAAALSSNEVLVAARGFDSPSGDQPTKHFSYLARFDGNAWHLESAPFQRVTGLWALGGSFAAFDDKATLWLRRSSGWLPVEWAPSTTPAPAEDAWARAPITQIIEADGASWLVQQSEPERGVTVSRVYRLTLP